MKLNIVQVGNTDITNELNIKNPHAAVANLRAAIAITFRVDSRSFVMSCKGQDLNDETQKLGAGGLELADGDTINISVRRQRESTNDTGVDAAAAAVPNNNTTTTNAGAAATAATTTTTSATASTSNNATTAAAPRAKPSGKKAKKSKKHHQHDGDDDDEDKPLDDVSAARSIRHVAAQASAHLNNKDKIPDTTSEDDEEDDDDDDSFDDEEDEEWLTDDGEEGEEEGEESEFDEEAEQEAREVSRMFDLLSALPNQAEMRQRFQTDPEGTLRTLQTENPELFQLINKHPQAFLEMANDEDFDGDDGEWIGHEDDEMASADLMRLLLAHAGQHQGDDSDSDGDDSDHEEDFLPEEPSTRSRRRGRGAGAARRGGRGGRSGGGARGRGGATSEDAAPAAPNNNNNAGGRRGRGRAAGGENNNNNAAATLTEEDNEKIMRIVELGFSKEQATRAYLRNGKNADRAAAWLFENQS